MVDLYCEMYPTTHLRLLAGIGSWCSDQHFMSSDFNSLLRDKVHTVDVLIIMVITYIFF